MTPIYPPKSGVDCRVCKLTFPLGQHNSELHFNGKRHLNNLPRKITVGGFPKETKTEEVNEYFLKFGQFTSFIPNKKCGTVTYVFTDPKILTSILQQDHTLKDVPLEIKWSTPLGHGPNVSTPPAKKVLTTKAMSGTSPVKKVPVTKATPGNSTETDTAIPSKEDQLKAKILLELSKTTDFSEQIAILESHILLDPQRSKMVRRRIHGDIKAGLEINYPSIRVNFFGSCVTGLSITSSDVDIYLGEVESTCENERKILFTIKRLLHQTRKFGDILVLSKPKVPIIKCFHRPTNTFCDINIHSKMGVYNSILIHYYLGLDPKLRPVMLAIKYWALAHEIKAVNYFSSYSLCLMYIFYLQQEPYKLPSVMSLQGKRQAPNHWNAAFTKIPDYKNETLEKASVQDLFVGFFEFYTRFDFMTDVVCPFMGVPFKKMVFSKDTVVPESFSFYKQLVRKGVSLKVDSPICVQDPFEHHLNVTRSVAINTAGKFYELCDASAKMGRRNEPNLLASMLTLSAPKLETISLHIANKPDVNVDERFNSFKKFTSDTLTKILQCVVHEKPVLLTVRSIAGSFDKSFSFYCECSADIWSTRLAGNVLPLLTPKMTEYEGEIALSAGIKKGETANMMMDVSFFMQKEPFDVRFCIIVKKVKFAAYVIHYLKVKLPKWFEDYENLASSTSAADILRGETVDKITADDKNVENAPIKIDSDKPGTSKDSNNGDNLIVIDDTPAQSENNSNVGKKRGEKAPLGESVTIQEVIDLTGTSTKDATDKSGANDAQPKSDDPFEDIEDEDVPADFFDDFANEDFMQGLDIVDAWDEDAGKPRNSDKQNGESKCSPVRTSETAAAVTKRKRSLDKPVRKSRSPVKRFRPSISPIRRYRSRSRNRQRSISRERRLKSKSPLRVRSRELSDRNRRDPEKTKRDIKKDKIRCAKDREMKIVSDKLKLVETGLVPPGTEMECDLSTVNQLKGVVEERNSDRDRNPSRPINSKERERRPFNSKERERRRFNSKERERRPFNSKERERRPFNSKERERRPFNSKERERRPFNSKERERRPFNSKERERRPFNSKERERRIVNSKERERRPIKRSLSRDRLRLSRSPLFIKRGRYEDLRYRLPRRRSASVTSQSSEREKWIRGRRSPRTLLRLRNRSRSKESPDRKTRKLEKEKKKSFLEEIRDKLNEVRPAPTPIVTYPQIVPTAYPAPVPPPAPVTYFSPNQPQYDQSFFIGDTYTPPGLEAASVPRAPTLEVGINASMLQGVNLTTSLPQFPDLSAYISQSSSKLGVQQISDSTGNSIDASTINNDIDKLFADKKISLSDFLTITAKPEVISRCQDVIKVMTEDKKLRGRLKVIPSREIFIKPLEVSKYQSPLRRVPVVRFQFTSASKSSDEVDPFTTALDSILRQVNIVTEASDLLVGTENSVVTKFDSVITPKKPTTFADKEAQALSAKASFLSQINSQSTPPQVLETVCEECTKRKSLTFASVGTQCMENGSNTVGTQVNEDDLALSRKKESLALLTPAQLLSIDKEKEIEQAAAKAAAAKAAAAKAAAAKAAAGKAAAGKATAAKTATTRTPPAASKEGSPQTSTKVDTPRAAPATKPKRNIHPGTPRGGFRGRSPRFASGRGRGRGRGRPVVFEEPRPVVFEEPRPVLFEEPRPTFRPRRVAYNTDEVYEELYEDFYDEPVRPRRAVHEEQYVEFDDHIDDHFDNRGNQFDRYYQRY